MKLGVKLIRSCPTKLGGGEVFERRGRVIQAVQEEFPRELLEHMLSVSLLL